MRFIGGAIGNTIYFNIYNQKIAKYLPQYVARYAVQAGLPRTSAAAFSAAYIQAANAGASITLAAFGGLEGVNQETIAGGALGLRWAYVESMKYVWYASIPFGIIACVCCLFMPNLKRYLTYRVAVDIH